MAQTTLEDRREYRRRPEVAERGRQQSREFKARLRARVAEYKMAAGCVDCGYAAHPAALDFDHTTDEKVTNIAALVSRNAKWETILAEIEKCEVVCSNCHRIRTVERRRGVRV